MEEREIKENALCEAGLTELSEACYAISKAHGWWDGEQNFPEKLCLLHSEVSEALEAHRMPGRQMSAKIPEFSAVEEELADAVIRILDMSAYYKFDIAGAVVAKMAYNETRPFRHGGKKC